MLRDWGARHGDFIELTARVRHGLLRIVDGESITSPGGNRARGRKSTGGIFRPASDRLAPPPAHCCLVGMASGDGGDAL